MKIGKIFKEELGAEEEDDMQTTIVKGAVHQIIPLGVAGIVGWFAFKGMDYIKGQVLEEEDDE